MTLLRVDHDALKRLRVLYPDCHTDGLLAERLGVNRSTVHRVLRGQQAPSNPFIARVRKVFGTQWYLELFEVVDK